MSSADAPCALDESWEDVMGSFREALAQEQAWSCRYLDGVDKDLILSAPEIMDPKTDAAFGYEKVFSLQYLLDKGELPLEPVLQSEETIVDLIDHLFASEVRFLQGYSAVQSFLSFPYFLRLDLLKEASLPLYAYCRAVLRTVDYVVRAVFTTTIRSDEEFMLVPPELDRQAEVAVEEIMAELDMAAAQAHSAALAARLRLRKDYLGALHLFLEAKRKSDIETACDLCEDIHQLLRQENVFARTSEPVVADGVLREHEMAYWVSVFTPAEPLAPLPFAEAMQIYQTYFRQLASLRTLFTPALHLTGVTEFVEQLAAQQPLLPMRSFAVIVLFSCDANESFLYGPTVAARLLETLATEYGSPLYLRLYNGDEAALEAVVKYRIQKTMDPLKVNPAQTLFLRQQTLDTLRRWVAEASKHYLLHLEMMLCNRGLAHRRLMNAMPGLGQFEEFSYFADMSVFLAGHPGTAEAVKTQCSKCSNVLTLYANAQVLRAMELVMHFFFELDLLTPGEVVPALWYVNFLQSAQAENYTMLCLQNTSFIPELRVNKKSHVPLHNLVIASRTAGIVDVPRVCVMEVSRMLSDAVFLAACLFEHKGLIDLTSAPKYSLISVENVFNHRMKKCFGPIRSPPFTPYQRCIHAKPKLEGEAAKRVGLYAKKASEVAQNAAERAKALLATHNDSTISTTTTNDNNNTTKELNEAYTGLHGYRYNTLHVELEGLERTARAVAVSLASFAAVCDDAALLAEYGARVERPALPHLLSFSMRKRGHA